MTLVSVSTSITAMIMITISAPRPANPVSTSVAFSTASVFQLPIFVMTFVMPIAFFEVSVLTTVT